MNGMRILVVDDEQGACTSTARMLRYQGCEVHTAENAKEAFAALRDGFHYDVVLVDLVLPDMEGLRLIREMQSADSSLHFLVVSGKLISLVERLDLASLGVRICAKPFRNKDLFELVRGAVQRESQPTVVNANA